RSISWRTLCSRSGVPMWPRKYFETTTFVASCDQAFGTSTPVCSKTVSPCSLPMRALRSSHSTSSSGFVPARVKWRGIASPRRRPRSGRPPPPAPPPPPPAVSIVSPALILPPPLPPPSPRPRRGTPRPAATPVPSGPGASPDPRDLCPVSHHACDRERSAGQYGARYPPEMREAPEPPAPPNRVRVLLPVPGSLPPDARLSPTPHPPAP